ncbi:AAA family ATPase [Methylobacterium brachythecii]|uniref:ATPase n=1 Tax=Methylobacterium brachythecii TaxID=1176177 RepID=A0A7W6F826_9HYPH|nr:AAA family ATPase [Methylobacterium brachythecii]MBB3903965.1 putative ATP-binding protein involved in virulence [Methylobacterium brachythecii]GLS42709.1 ATPase [Methylobacterium brachythecii]
MHLVNLEIENFRALKSVKVVLDPKVNVFAGVNGSGKSTLLVAVDLLFSRYVSAMSTGRPVMRGPSEKDVASGSTSVLLAAAAVDGNKKFGWYASSRFRGLHNQTKVEGSEEFREFIKRQLAKFETDDKASVPLFATYPVSRSDFAVSLKVRKGDDYRQSAAFQATSFGKARNFDAFFTWFRQREDFENERRLDRSDYRDHQLTAVREAIERLLPAFRDLRVRRQPLRLVVKKENTEFDVEDLSHGEKGLIALAGDLARRLSLANPGLQAPLTGSGIVMIDELELHLHPAWQRNAVNGLQAAFPRIQFIFTTHSPQIISEVQPEQIFLLKDGSAVPAVRSYGMESTQVLRELMGDPGRPPEVEHQLQLLDDLIDRGSLDEGEAKLNEMVDLLGENYPTLMLARSRIRRSKALRDFEAHR